MKMGNSVQDAILEKVIRFVTFFLCQHNIRCIMRKVDRDTQQAGRGFQHLLAASGCLLFIPRFVTLEPFWAGRLERFFLPFSRVGADKAVFA